MIQLLNCLSVGGKAAVFLNQLFFHVRMCALSLREKQSIVANTEHETLFFTAIKLLNSTAKTSTDQLKALLDEALAQKSVCILRFNVALAFMKLSFLRKTTSR